jgi:putative transposase
MDESHYWAALRYVELNPVRAGIVRVAEEYLWSSAAAHCGLIEDSLLLPLPPGTAVIGSWSDWLKAGDNPRQLEFIRKCTKTGRPCGDDTYIKELEKITGRVLISRKVGRPSKKRALVS